MKGLTIASIFTAVDKMSAPMKRMGANMQSFASSAQTGIAHGERMFRRLTPALSETTSQMLSFTKTAALAGLIIGGISFTTSKIKEYDKSLGALRSITGQTVEEFKPLRATIIQVAKDAKVSSVDTVDAFGKIASLNSTFLESSESMGMVSRAAIILKKASGDELGASAENLVGIMNQFNLGAKDADRTINVLAAGAGVGAASIIQTSEAFKNFGSVAAGANISLEKSTALVQVLGKFSVMGAEAGTKLRGSVLKLQQAGVGYASGQFDINNALEEARAKVDKLKTAKQKDALLTKMFGAENISTGRILLSNIGLFNQFTNSVSGTNDAYKQADINSDTLTASLDEVSAAWVTMVTGSENTTGALELVKNAAQFVSSNMETIASIGLTVVGVLAALKGVLLVTKLAMIDYNVVLGITGALSGTVSVAVGKNAIALGAYKTVTWLATAAQWAWNAAMTANPIGLIVVGIMALIGLVAVIITKWNDWGAALSIFLGPLGLVISLIQSFRRNWEMIQDAFKNGGILAGLKAIGKVIIDAVLMPVQQLLKLIGNITGSESILKAAKGIEIVRNSLGVNTESDENGQPISPIVNPKAATQEALSQRLETTQKQNVKIDIADQTGRARVESDNDFVPVNLTSTVGF